MPRDPLLLLSASDPMFHPNTDRCPNCGGDFRRGVTYLSAGALLLSEDGQDSIHTDRFRAFFHVGIHGPDTEMRDSSDVQIVQDLAGGQFDLQWCSVACMRTWFLGVLDEMERRSQQPPQPDQD